MTELPLRQIILIAHNLRSCHNVGSLLRTADGLGVQQVILSGYSPYPQLQTGELDSRMPHIALKLSRQINKTALGAETMVDWKYEPDILPVLSNFRSHGWQVAAIEQTGGSIALPDFAPHDKLVLIVGREVEGIEPEILAAADVALEIPMFGQKESFNVVQAAAMSLYHCRFT